MVWLVVGWLAGVEIGGSNRDSRDGLLGKDWPPNVKATGTTNDVIAHGLEFLP